LHSGTSARRANHLLGPNRSRHSHAIFGLWVVDSVPADDQDTSFGCLVCTSLHHPREQIGVQFSWPAHEVERQQGLGTHRMDVAHRVRRRDRPPGVGVVDDGGKEINGLNQREIWGDSVHAGVVGRLQTEKQVGVSARSLSLFQVAQDLRQVLRT